MIQFIFRVEAKISPNVEFYMGKLAEMPKGHVKISKKLLFIRIDPATSTKLHLDALMIFVLKAFMEGSYTCSITLA